jgi:hypothetical protein
MNHERTESGAPNFVTMKNDPEKLRKICDVKNPPVQGWIGQI